MIGTKQISTSDTDLYNYMEQLLITSFPVEEYRDLEELKKYTDTIPVFYNNIIFDDDTPIGFVSYWDLDSFYYIEHFAIAPSNRNGGYGQKLLKYLREKFKKPIVLEVELPEEEMAKRRINFYKRQGYELWEKEYFQPPYKTGHNNLPMLIMVNGELNCDKDFNTIKGMIHKVVYNAG